MKDLLFLAHRIPYPPDKGEKIRAWHVLRHLAERYRVHLATFIDAPEDVAGVRHLEEVCASVVWRKLSPRRARLRSLAGLLNSAPLTQFYFGDRRLHAEVERLAAANNPALVYVFSSAMAPYVPDRRGVRVILDMVDVDSEKWRQYAEAGSGPARMIYRREGRTLLALERRAASRADAVLLVSRAEAALFASLAPEVAGRTHCVGNGVDLAYFDPSLPFANPLGDRPAIVFTGVMSYRPNVEAMVWFVEQVMPRLRARAAVPCLWIVGLNPSRAVLALAGPDVRVTGRVPDVRPYLKHAQVAVAPLLIGRGVQNKVLEAMAMGLPVVATPQAREGIDSCDDGELLTATTPADFAAAIGGVLDGEAGPIGARARARVVRDYGWQASLAGLDRLLDSIENAPSAMTRPATVAPLSVSA
ncbi:MAG: TIGR03087 family PEP-CTERM/XrtA system glycosyltransferase [Alphaproteobacteria bacterium]